MRAHLFIRAISHAAVGGTFAVMAARGSVGVGSENVIVGIAGGLLLFGAARAI